MTSLRLFFGNDNPIQDGDTVDEIKDGKMNRAIQWKCRYEEVLILSLIHISAYAKEGADLVLTGRNEQKLLDAKEELERLYGIQVLPMQADVTPEDEAEDRVKQVVEKTMEVFGRIDILINNAQASASGIPLAMQTPRENPKEPPAPGVRLCSLVKSG